MAPDSSQPASDHLELARWLAVQGLRAELLWIATGYGLAMGMAEGGEPEARRWDEWLYWVHAFLHRLREAAERLGITPAADTTVPADWSTDWSTELRELVATFEEAGYAPIVLGTDGLRETWSQALERLAERARSVEEFMGKPLGEFEGQEFGAGVALLGAVEDSLLLTISEAEDKRGLAADAEEIRELLLAAREEGVWDVLLAS